MDLAKIGQPVGSTLVTKDAFDDLTRRKGFTSPLQLTQPMSDAVTDPKVNAKPGEFIFNLDKNLGNKLDVIPLDYRPHAIQLDNSKSVVAETFAMDGTYDMIKQNCDNKVQNYLSGLDFLVYIPAEDKFAVFFMYKTVLKGAAASMRDNIHKLVTLQSRIVEWKSYKWYVADVIPSTLTEYNKPTDEALVKMVEEFKAATQPVVSDDSRPR